MSCEEERRRRRLVECRADAAQLPDLATNEELVTKFYGLADRVTSRDRATAIEQATVGLEELDDISELIDLLAPPVAGVLD